MGNDTLREDTSNRCCVDNPEGRSFSMDGECHNCTGT